MLVIREVKLKTTTRNHLTPVRMSGIKKSTNNKYWRGCGVKETFLHCWWECKLVLPLENSMDRRAWQAIVQGVTKESDMT